jgi:predicted metal-dependent hydrolase
MNDIQYKIKRNPRLKRLRIIVENSEFVTVRANPKTRVSTIEKFIQQEASWIRRQFLKFKHEKILLVETTDMVQTTYASCKNRSLKLVRDKVIYWNNIYAYEYNKILVKNVCSQWGSCSSKKNLNFNYKLLFLPEHLQDYIIVHELSHLGEMNHSRRFWNLVEKAIPEYRKCIVELKKYVI